MALDWKDALASLRADVPEGAPDPEPEAAPERSGIGSQSLRVVLDRKGRKGKVAVIVDGFTCSDDEVAEVAAMLKRKLGVGGSARGGEILIQGDRLDQVADLLRSQGHKVKEIR